MVAENSFGSAGYNLGRVAGTTFKREKLSGIGSDALASVADVEFAA